MAYLYDFLILLTLFLLFFHFLHLNGVPRWHGPLFGVIIDRSLHLAVACCLPSFLSFFLFFFSYPFIGSCLSIAGVGLVFGHLRVQLMALILLSLFAPLAYWNLRVAVANRLISSFLFEPA